MGCDLHADMHVVLLSLSGVTGPDERCTAMFSSFCGWVLLLQMPCSESLWQSNVHLLSPLWGRDALGHLQSGGQSVGGIAGRDITGTDDSGAQ